MSDAIKYCDTCPMQVTCHMERQCLRPKCSNCGEPATYRALHREAGTVRICEDCRKTHRGDHTEIMQIWPPPMTNTPPPANPPETDAARQELQINYDCGKLHSGIEGVFLKMERLERERDQARELAGYYRDGGDDNKRKRETAMAAAIGAGYCGHLRGPETHSC